MSSYVLKAKFGDDLRRLTLGSPHMSQLVSSVSSLFGLSSPLKIRYMDDDGDWITISSDQELQEAFLTVTGLPLRIEVALTSVPSPSFVVVKDHTKEVVSEDEQEGDESESEEELESEDEDEEEDDEDDEDGNSLNQSTPSVTLAEDKVAQEEEESVTQKEAEGEASVTLSHIINPATNDTGDDIPPPSEPHPFAATEKEPLPTTPELPQAEFFDYITNEFHYHRLIIQTAVESAFESMKTDYKPKAAEYLNKAETQRELIIGAIEKTLEEWKRDVDNYPPAQEISRRVSESLHELGTFAAPVIDNIRASLTAVLEQIFKKQNPHAITTSEVLRELDTFTPRPEDTPSGEETAQITQEIDSLLREQEQPQAPSDVEVKSDLADDFVYLQEEQPVVVEDEEQEGFAFQAEFQELMQMGFTDENLVREALTEANGNMDVALDSLLYH